MLCLSYISILYSILMYSIYSPLHISLHHFYPLTIRDEILYRMWMGYILAPAHQDKQRINYEMVTLQ
jgi:hypothetical protein